MKNLVSVSIYSTNSFITGNYYLKIRWQMDSLRRIFLGKRYFVVSRDISPTYNRQLFGLASLVAAALPYIMVPLFMGWFTTSGRHNWQYNFILNGVIILLGRSSSSATLHV
jgi:hypothetical protein